MAELLGFTAQHVSKLTGLSAAQIRYWDRTDFFSPTFLDEHRHRNFNRIYSFRDVVGLRVISVLRNEHKIPLQELRRVGEWLHDHYASPWSSLRFALHGRKVVFLDPKTGAAIRPQGKGQTILEIVVEPIAEEMRSKASTLTERCEADVGRIVRNRFVVHNAWVIAGTRIPTSAVWNFHEAGYTNKQIIAEYPRLTGRDVEAALKFEKDRRQDAA